MCRRNIAPSKHEIGHVTRDAAAQRPWPAGRAALGPCAEPGSRRQPRRQPPTAGGPEKSPQTGRVLRHFLYEGLNEGADGKAIYDGLLPHIAGGQRGDFNHRFAQPSSLGVHSLGQCFPFAGREAKDPFTKSVEGVYKGRISTIPKVILTNTSVEYWRGDGALTHVMPDGKNDIEPLSNERIYLFSGTHHVNGIFPKTNTNSLTGLKARYDFNTIDHSPLLRGALNNLFEWVVRGIEPPDSRNSDYFRGNVGKSRICS